MTMEGQGLNGENLKSQDEYERRQGGGKTHERRRGIHRKGGKTQEGELILIQISTMKGGG